MLKELDRFYGIWGVLGSPLRQSPWVTSVPAHWISNVPALLVCIQLAFSSRDPIVLLLTVSFLTTAISSLQAPVSQMSLRCSCQCWGTKPEQVGYKSESDAWCPDPLGFQRRVGAKLSSKSPSAFPPLFPHLAVTLGMNRESQGLILFNLGLQLCVLKYLSCPFPASVSPLGKQQRLIMLPLICTAATSHKHGGSRSGEFVSLARDQVTRKD